MEAKLILCFVLIGVCMVEARDLTRKDSRYHYFSDSSYPGYSSDSYMYSYSGSYPGYSSDSHMYSYSGGYPGYSSDSYMYSYSGSYPGYSSDSHMYSYSGGYPGYSSDSYMYSYSGGYPGHYSDSYDYSSSYGYSGYSSGQEHYYECLSKADSKEQRSGEDPFEALSPSLVLECVIHSLGDEKAFNFYDFADCMEHFGLIPPEYLKRGFKRTPVSSDDGKDDKEEDDGDDKDCDENKAIFDRLCKAVEEKRKRAEEAEIGEIEEVLLTKCPERDDSGSDSTPKDGPGKPSDAEKPSEDGSPKKFPGRQPLLKNRNAGKVMRLINMLKHLN